MRNVPFRMLKPAVLRIGPIRISSWGVDTGAWHLRNHRVRTIALLYMQTPRFRICPSAANVSPTSHHVGLHTCELCYSASARWGCCEIMTIRTCRRGHANCPVSQLPPASGPKQGSLYRSTTYCICEFKVFRSHIVYLLRIKINSHVSGASQPHGTPYL